MEKYFVRNDLGYMSLIENGFEWDNVGDALVDYDNASTESPTTLYGFENGTLFQCMNPWKHATESLVWEKISAAYVAVRKYVGTNYNGPYDTLICDGGIFRTVAEAEEYTKNHGGSWKIYTFSELKEKLHEDSVYEENEKRRRNELLDVELPF